mgnify:CR=1 FL=1
MIQDRINKLKQAQNAVILSHTYQPPEIQDMADFVGDSYGLSKQAGDVTADVIVFCGVRFMAETAAVLNRERTVLMPDLRAGCPMADMITADQLRKLKGEHPDAAVVCYVNSSADVKAESTVCCTSSNAVQIVQALADAPEIIFVPDKYLGKFVERRTERNLILWEGYCPTHANVTADTIRQARTEHPDAAVMVHPECTPEVQDEADHVLSTGQMLDLVKQTDRSQFIVGTEYGIIHTLKKAAPHITYVSLSSRLVCPNMKRVTLEKIRQSLETGRHRINVPPDIADGAEKAITRMLDIVEHGRTTF